MTTEIDICMVVVPSAETDFHLELVPLAERRIEEMHGRVFLISDDPAPTNEQKKSAETRRSA